MFSFPLNSGPFFRRLQSVSVEGAQVSEFQEFLLGEPGLDGGLSLPGDVLVTPVVLAAVGDAEDNGRDDGKEADGETHTETGWVFGSLGREVDVGTTDTTHLERKKRVKSQCDLQMKRNQQKEKLTHVSNTDQQCHADSTLARRGEVVADQRDHARKGAVQTDGDEEQEKVGHAGQARVRDGQLADEPDTGDGEAAHQERRALLDAIGPPRDPDRGEGGGDVDGDGHQLGVRVAVPEVLDDGRHGRGEAVGADTAAPEGDDGEPDSPVPEPGLERGPVDPVGVGDAAGAGAGVQRDPVDHELTLADGEELGRLGLVREEEVKREGDGYRGQAFEDEDPFPPREACDPVHFLDGKSEETRKCTRQRGCGVEDCHTSLDFVSSIPNGKEL